MSAGRLTLDLLEENRDDVVVEWQSATEQHVQDDSSRPDIDLGTRVQPFAAINRRLTEVS